MVLQAVSPLVPRIRLFVALAVFAATAAAQSSPLDAGIAHYNARRWSEAHVAFAAAVKAQPTSDAAAYWYGKALMAEDKPSDAEDQFARATQLNPRSSEYQLWLARAIGLQAQRASVIRQPFLARRTKSAIDKAVALDADNIDAREMRWEFYTQAPGFMGGGEDKAREEAAEIMRRNRYRGQFVALNAAGRAKDQAGVERVLKAMTAEFPDSVLPMGNYAGWLADKGRASEAFAAVEAFQKRRPSDPVALYHLGRVAAISGQQLDRGTEALKRYLTVAPPPTSNLVPTLSSAHFRLGNIAEKRGDKGTARAEYETAVQLDARNMSAKKALAALK
jgi:predicted Zn-dependent protease